MTEIRVNGANLHYQEDGPKHEAGTETIVFSHGLLMSSDMFRAQIDALRGQYRCIAYDHRGQGRSEVTQDGYDMDTVAQDAFELIRALDAAPCHFVGLSMGGFVGMRLAIRHPELLRSLVLLETSADPEPNVWSYRMLAAIGRWFGFRPVIGPVMNIMFGQTFMTDPARAAERLTWRNHILNSDRDGVIRAAHGVIDREGVYEQLERITTPTLIIVGEEDTATTPDKAHRLHAAIAGSKLAVIPGAGHSSSIEAPAAVTRAISSFIANG